MNQLVIPQHLRENQRKASDPAASIWVSANAGSGKTHVLTQRVIRLLLSGVAPSKILCLTFTKAAAAQMATRVFDTLSKWTMLDDIALRAAIVETGAANPTAADLLLARRLFTRTIETPGGLKIQTIHAFCERLLHLFPFEANVPARFEVADDLRAQELMSRAKRAAIERAQRSSGPLKTALQLVADLAGSSGIDQLISAAMRLRAPVRRYPRDLQSELPRRLGIAGQTPAADIRRAMVEGGLAPGRWSDLAGRLDSGTTNERKHATRLRGAIAAYAHEAPAQIVADTLATYLQVFFDSTDKPRPAILTKRLAAADPALDADLMEERDRLVGLRANLAAAEAVERTEALLALVEATAETYERSKIATGLLDFDDLIERTLSLLDRSDSGWVLHKLDSGIDHVLVDEAQDTSEAQWQILEALTGDFATGHGGNATRRSFFVVGDDKQSIFSFQGAAPLMFDTMRGAFERRFKAGQKAFDRVSLKTSFRSVPGILAAVDQVFATPARHDGLVQPSDVWPGHESIKATLPGMIEIWPRVAATAPPQDEDWKIPLDIPPEQDPTHIVADRVARKIKALTARHSGEWVHDKGGRRPIRPGDILVLVRTRNAFFEAVIRALKRHYVNVAGADRLDVANHIAVMDLVVAGRAALLPQDDLSLAALLRSPLFGFTDEDLLAIAPSRRGALVDALAQSDRPHHRDAYARLRMWQTRAAGSTPFAFYIELLGRDGGRRLMESRLGPEAHDAIDEFLRLALAHEKQGAPSLVTFLDDVEALESSIRRDLEGPGDAVRVMTVHAAKGLEAKIVFLPDTCQVPSQQFEPTIFDLAKISQGEPAGGAPVLVWSPRKGDDPPIVASARTAERQATMREYRRLLYVALTRAEERLYICGFYNTREPPPDCWSAMIDASFPEAEEVPSFWDADETIRRLATPGSAQEIGAVRAPAEQHPLGLAPDWLFQPVPTAPVSVQVRATRSVRDATPERQARLGYGSALHLLLEHLPNVAAAERGRAGRAFLAQRDDLVPATSQEALLAEVIAVLATPQLEPLFGATARAEVPVIGRATGADGRVETVNAVVDRLVVEPTRVLVAEFKTGRADDRRQTEYLRQLSLYRDVLSPLWPDRPVSGWLIWTRDCKIVDLDDKN